VVAGLLAAERQSWEEAGDINPGCVLVLVLVKLFILCIG
jgi:hypothetical protein